MWLRTTACNAGDACRFKHSFESAVERERAERMRAGRAERQERDRRAQSEYRDNGGFSMGGGGVGDDAFEWSGSGDRSAVRGDGCHGGGEGGKKAKALRARIFSAWLRQQFGAATLARGRGVLDVAGGKGALSVELLLQSPPGLEATVIDPYIRRYVIKYFSLYSVYVQYTSFANLYRDRPLHSEVRGSHEAPRAAAAARGEEPADVRGGDVRAGVLGGEAVWGAGGCRGWRRWRRWRW